MGTIIVKTDEQGIQAGEGALLHIPEELWELSKKNRVYVEDTQTGERVLVIDMNEPVRPPVRLDGEEGT